MHAGHDMNSVKRFSPSFTDSCKELDFSPEPGFLNSYHLAEVAAHPLMINGDFLSIVTIYLEILVRLYLNRQASSLKLGPVDQASCAAFFSVLQAWG